MNPWKQSHPTPTLQEGVPQLVTCASPASPWWFGEPLTCHSRLCIISIITVMSVITSSLIWASPVSWFNQESVEKATPCRLWAWALRGSGSWQPLFRTLRSPELPCRESVTAGENFWRGPRVPWGREDPFFWGPCQSSRQRNETLVDCPVLVPIWRQSHVRPHTRA